MQTLPPKLGFNHHFPSAALYDPALYGGRSMRHIYLEQGSLHVFGLIKHIRSSEPLGDLLLILVKWTRQMSGFSFCPLRRPSSSYHHIEHGWMMTIITILSECNASLDLFPSPPQLTREYDSHIMDDVMHLELKRPHSIQPVSYLPSHLHTQ